MNPLFLFFSNFLKNPKDVGAIVPLSQSVIKQLIKYLNSQRSSTPCRILEVGAGIGNITKFIVKSLRDHDNFDIVEISPSCCKLLDSSFGHDSRVSIKCMSILDWQPHHKYDSIISTLPFNSFNPQFIRDIFHHYQNLLLPQGVLTYVEYMGLHQISRAFSRGEKKRVILERRDFLNNMQGEYLIEKKGVFANFPPCHVYHMQIGTPLR